MLAAWYERAGLASEVLHVGDMPDPEPGAGEVRIRLTRSGANPGDVKKRGDWVSLGMPYPRIIPHSDRAGVIDKLGSGVHDRRVGQRVWIYGAQSYRPFGTAAQLTTVPANQAVPLPDEVSDDVGACLGIPGITAHRAVFADGPITGHTVSEAIDHCDGSEPRPRGACWISRSRAGSHHRARSARGCSQRCQQRTLSGGCRC